jgi:hypothetical protein
MTTSAATARDGHAARIGDQHRDQTAGAELGEDDRRVASASSSMRVQS